MNGASTMPDTPPTTASPGVTRRWTVIASGLLLLALGLVVLFTKRHEFLSPVALVVVAAIGFAAMLLQLRFRKEADAIHSPLWLNIIGVVCALLALGADYFRIGRRVLDLVAFGAVVCFGISGALILRRIRRHPTPK